MLVQILSGLITYLLLAVYCHENHGERGPSAEYGNSATKSRTRHANSSAPTRQDHTTG
ncbi:MAG: hypothetical protein PHI97_15660 [Desulfobulbus sp.]|nr:hypothetical protein [Desulfobulbus sp.]